MRRLIAAAILLASIAAVSAQVMAPPSGTSALVMVQGGVVYIDWDAVRRTAKGGDQPILVTAAQVMLAIRNGTWKPMKGLP